MKMGLVAWKPVGFVFLMLISLVGIAHGRRQPGGRGRGRSSREVVHLSPVSGQRIRLAGNSGAHNQGLVEVNRAGRWGLVCDDGWEIVDANVACQQLGFFRGAVEALGEAAFGHGQWINSTDILMDDIECRGTERMLQMCDYIDRNHNCDLSEAASVTCYQNGGCDEGWIAGPNGCYKFLETPVRNVKHASNLCIRAGGYLTVIETSEEADFLSNTLRLLHPDKTKWATSGRYRKGEWMWEKVYRQPRPPKPTRPPRGRGRGRGRSRSQKRGRSPRSTYPLNDLRMSVSSHEISRTRRAQPKKRRRPSNIKERIPLTFTKWFPGWLPDNTFSEPSRKKGEFCLILTSMYEYSRRQFDSVDYLFWDNTRCRFRGEPVYAICEKDQNLPNTKSRSQQCYHGNGESYRGHVQHTRLGSDCQSWALGPDMDPDETMGLGDHNYCRNPDKSTSPWCWVDVSQGLFGYCPVPECDTPDLPVVEAQCPKDEYFCSQNSPEERCIPASFQCDGESDCEGDQDEIDCDYKLPLFEKTENAIVNADQDVRYIHASIELCAKFCVESTDIVCRSFTYKKGQRECSLFRQNLQTTSDPDAFLLPSNLYDYYQLTTQTADCRGMFKCRNTKCIARDLVCNGQDDCNDLSDESQCDNNTGETQIPFEIRLRGGRLENEGRVEIRYRGEWGVICDDGWDLKDAKVVCNMLGYRNALRASILSMYGPGNANFLLSNINCRGNESSLLQCQKPNWKDHLCSSYEVAGVECQSSKQTTCDPAKEFSCPEKCIQISSVCDREQDCSDGADEINCRATFSLVNGSRPNEGRLQMTLNGIVGTVCDDGFGVAEATVTCRMLGYSYGLKSNASYGQGSGVIWLDDLNCEGRESNLEDCTSNPYAVHNCEHSEDVGVVCSNQAASMTTTSSYPSGTIPVKLVGGNATYGRVHVYLDGEWGTVCDDSWDDKDATIVCRMLNFAVGKTVLDFPGAKSVDILMDEVQCIGTERDLGECHFSREHDCTHTEDVAVACYSQSSDVCNEEEYRCPEKCIHGSKLCNDINNCVDGDDENDCSEVIMSLVNSTNAYSGRLQVTMKGLEGTVCDDNFGETEATVACRSFGYNYGGHLSRSGQFGHGRGMIWLDNLNCNGDEDNLIQCKRNHFGVEDCDHSEDVGIICYQQPRTTAVDMPTETTTVARIGCSNAQFECSEKCIPIHQVCNRDQECLQGEDEADCDFNWELIDGDGRTSGRLQLSLNGMVGTVCDDGFGAEEIVVACRMFGFNYGGVLTEEFGGGTGLILLDDLNCTGRERSLQECRHNPLGDENCVHTEDVGIRCHRVPPTQPATTTKAPVTPASEVIELVGGSGPNEGRLEVIIDGQRGTVCDDRWTKENSDIVCSMLGYNDGGMEVSSSVFGYGDERTPILLDDVECFGFESSILDCPRAETHNCQHTEDVGIRCILPRPPVSEGDEEDVDEDAYLFPGCGQRPLGTRQKQEADELKELAAPPRVAKIVGGDVATYGLFPWQVGVRKVYFVSRSGRKYTSAFCGGTVISEDWVLSAAHCFEGHSKESFTIRVGDHNNKEIASFEEGIEQEFDLEEIINHESYDDNSYDYDMALLKVKRKQGQGIQFNPHVQPACLPRASTGYLEGLTCHISGWGTLESDGASPSLMQKAEVPLLSERTCRNIYGNRQTNRMFCAGILAGGIDTCQGDSGGPLVCQDEQEKFLLYGITSWGIGCGRPNQPGMYSHVKVLMPWVRDTIKRYT